MIALVENRLESEQNTSYRLSCYGHSFSLTCKKHESRNQCTHFEPHHPAIWINCIVQQITDNHAVYSKFFLKLLDQGCGRCSEGYLNNFSTELSTQIFDCCPRNFLIQEERIGNVVSTSHWIRPVVETTVQRPWTLRKAMLSHSEHPFLFW